MMPSASSGIARWKGTLLSPGSRASAVRPWIPRAVLVLGFLGLFVASGRMWISRAETSAPRASADSVDATPDTTAPPQRVMAYYFHTTRRCVSCRKIEAYSQEAIESGFADALKAGRLVWQVVNVEEKGNEHFVKDYKLFTKSVVLVAESDSVLVRWKNLPRVWELLNDKAAFIRYIQGETQAYLTGME